MRKSVKVVLSIFLILTLSTSLSASSLIRDITGKENKGITVKYNNQVQNLKDGNGSPVYPVIINGSTYLPVRAIADMLGADITWEGETKTIYITGNGTQKDVGSAVPTDLPSSNNNSSSSNSNNNETSKTQNNTSSSNKYRATSNAGTFEDPIEMRTSYTYNYTSGWENNVTNADYTVTVTDVNPITRDDIQDLGFQRPEENALLDYVMVTMKLDVNNATYEGENSYYLNNYLPDFFTVKTTDGNWIVGYETLGFTGALRDEVDFATKTSDNHLIKVHPNESKSFSAEGKIIVTIIKNSKNLLSIENDDSSKYTYFKLY